MTGEAWRRHLETYVALRRAVGFAMRPEARLLQDFIEHLERRGPGAPAAQVAVEWASASTESQHARRLSIVRGFLTMVRAAEPDVDVPGAGLVRTSKRPTPRILEPHEILALMEAARSLGPRDALRPHTVATMIGLLASCGLRAGEAIRLDVDHVDLVGDLSCLQIQRTKFRKSRLVPLHPTTAAALQAYAQQRRDLGYDGLCSAFFVSERGARLNCDVLARTFVQLARRLGLRGPVGTRGVSLHKLRHGFAVGRLAAWAQQGVVVRDRLPALAVYLGHVSPQNTYWYLGARQESEDLPPWGIERALIGRVLGWGGPTMPEAHLTEPLDHAAEKGGLEEMFAALEAAVEADVDAFLRRGNVNAQDFETLLQTVHRRALATASQAVKVIGAQRS